MATSAAGALHINKRISRSLGERAALALYRGRRGSLRRRHQHRRSAHARIFIAARALIIIVAC